MMKKRGRPRKQPLVSEEELIEATHKGYRFKELEKEIHQQKKKCDDQLKALKISRQELRDSEARTGFKYFKDKPSKEQMFRDLYGPFPPDTKINIESGFIEIPAGYDMKPPYKRLKPSLWQRIKLWFKR